MHADLHGVVVTFSVRSKSFDIKTANEENLLGLYIRLPCGNFLYFDIAKNY